MTDTGTMRPPVCVAAMYLFADLGSIGIDLGEIGGFLRERMAEAGVRGTIVLAPEGINGTIAGSDEAVAGLVDLLRGDARLGGRLGGLRPTVSWCGSQPFGRGVVKVRPEIVTLRAAGVDPRERVGAYVEPEEWNALVDDPDVLVVDTRNDFEVRMGTFVSRDGRRAINPRTSSFGAFPGFVERELREPRRTVAMFCTGGIRCEKATSYLLARGFTDVRHLRGGILGYLGSIEATESRWEGACFVFDERVAVGHGLVPADGVTMPD